MISHLFSKRGCTEGPKWELNLQNHSFGRIAGVPVVVEEKVVGIDPRPAHDGTLKAWTGGLLFLSLTVFSFLALELCHAF